MTIFQSIPGLNGFWKPYYIHYVKDFVLDWNKDAVAQNWLEASDFIKNKTSTQVFFCEFC